LLAAETPAEDKSEAYTKEDFGMGEEQKKH